MVNYTLYKFGQFLSLHLPLKFAYRIAIFFCDVHYVFADKDRRQVWENLKVIFPEKNDRELRRIRLAMFRNFAKYLVDFFRFEKIDQEYIRRYVKLENMHYFDQALSRGKGLVSLTAHIGNWELGGAVMSLSGYPCSAVALEHKSKKVNEFFNAQRQGCGMTVIPFTNAVRACLKTLRENKIVALVGDRDFTEAGVTVDFFGKPTSLPAGPAVFALKTGAAIIPGFMLRHPDDTFTLVMEKPVEFTPSGDHESDIRNLIRTYKTVIEDYIRRYPEQWFMFRRFWTAK